MLFVSSYSQYVANIVSPEYVMVGEGAYKKLTEQAGLVAEFKPLHGEVEYRGPSFPLKKGKFRGIFETDDPIMINGLFDHKRYGVDFVALDERTGEVADDDQMVIYPLGEDGEWYCSACDIKFANAQGAKGHGRSAKHKEMHRAAMIA